MKFRTSRKVQKGVRSSFASIAGCVLLVIAGWLVPWSGAGGGGSASADGPRIVYVTEQGAGTKDGSSWEDAWDGRDLQGAIDAAQPGTQIWVAAGTYLPTVERGGSGAKYRSFSLKNGVEVYGGFAGWETRLAQRDWLTNRTVLSGDLNGNGTWDFNSSDACHVFYHPEGIDRTAVLDGVVITGAGGCIGNHEGNGGGMYNAGGSSPTIRNALFEKNRANSVGGALWVRDLGTRPWLENVVLRGNRADSAGGGLGVYSGGAPVLVNVAIVGNWGQTGGGIYLVSMGSESVVMTHVTVAGNGALVDGGVSALGSQGGRLVIRNSVLYGNRPGNAVKLAGCSYCFPAAPSAPEADIAHSIVEGSGGSGAGWNAAFGNDLGGNLDADPEFVDMRDPSAAPTTEGDYRLRENSPAVDAGDPEVFAPGGQSPDLSAVVHDAEGGLRRIGSSVDMGAYEWPDDRFPAWPAGATLTVDATVAGRAALSWPAADDTDTVSYSVYVNGALQATVGGAVYDYTVTGLSGGTYRFAVRAADAAGHETRDLEQVAQIQATPTPTPTPTATPTPTPTATPTPTPPTTPEPVRFSDVTGHWAAPVLTAAVQQGIIEGYGDGTFRPDRPVTRAELAVMLYRALKLRPESAAVPFADADRIGAWAQEAVAVLAEKGILAGYEDGTFRPDRALTRAEAAVLLARGLGLVLREAGAATGFADDAAIPSWARAAVAALKELGLLEGRAGGRFEPEEPLTRAEAVTLLMRAMEVVRS